MRKKGEKRHSMDLYKELTEIESSISDTEFEKRLKFLMDETFSYLLQKAQRQKFDTDESHRQKQQSILEYADWMRLKARLRYEPDKKHRFPIIIGGIYWAHLGRGIKVEQEKHRPVLVLRYQKGANRCVIIPLARSAFNDQFWFHVDLDLDIQHKYGALIEQIRAISTNRIDNPLRVRGELVQIKDHDREKIHDVITRFFRMPKFLRSID